MISQKNQKLKIRIFTAVWGQDYENLFLNVNLPSILFDLERITFKYDTQICVYCDEEFSRKIILAVENNFESAITFDFTSFKQLGFQKKGLPNENMGSKYELISSLQRHFFENAPIDSCLVFNYADFFWTKGTIGFIINQIFNSNNTAVFSFCPPVRRKFFMQKFQKTHSKNRVELITEMINNNLIEYLHPEVFRRDSSQKEFSVMPSYIVNIQHNSGIILHAYHQTTLALVKIPDIAKLGMHKGTLDGYFSGFLYDFLKKNKKRFFFLCNMNSHLIVSLHPDSFSSNELKKSIFKNKNEPSLLQKMFCSAITKAQLPMSEVTYYWRLPQNLRVEELQSNKIIKMIRDVNKKNERSISFNGVVIKKIGELSKGKGGILYDFINIIKKIYRIIYRFLILD